jgi:hypothetical protein
MRPVGVPLLKEAAPEDTDPGSKEEREAKALEIADAQKPDPADKPDDEDDPDDAAETEPEKDDSDASASARKAGPRLASGDDPKLAAGYVDGQDYADRLAARSRERGADGLANFIEQIDDLIDGSDSLEAARDKLISLYRDSDPPTEMVTLLDRMIQMAHRAGAGAVQADTPELTFGEN